MAARLVPKQSVAQRALRLRQTRLRRRENRQQHEKKAAAAAATTLELVERLTENQLNKLCTLAPTIFSVLLSTSRAPIKANVVYHLLNVQQQKIFEAINVKISQCTTLVDSDYLLNGGSIHLIDAAPGTGKTFLVSALMMSLAIPCRYLAYSRSLQKAMTAFSNVDSQTCCGFLMRSLNKKFFSAINMWYSRELSFHAHCATILGYVRDSHFDRPIVIIDEYTVLSPWMIAYFVWCAEVHDLHLIFVGDKYQHAPMSPTKFFPFCNYSLVEMHIPFEHRFSLTESMRQSEDAHFQYKLSQLVAVLKPHKNVSMNFVIKYMLYELFQEKFHKAESDDALYMAQYHESVRQRLERYDSTKGLRMPMVLLSPSGEWIEPSANYYAPTKKFVSYLYLRRGLRYLYMGDQAIVTLEKIGRNTLTIRSEDTGKLIVICRRAVNSSWAPKEMLHWLEQRRGRERLYQYPLRPYSITYHAIQGITLNVPLADLDVDVSHVTSLYVGLSRFRKASQINSLRSSELASLQATRYYNDQYYYITEAKTFHKDIKFREAQSFMRRGHWKVPRKVLNGRALKSLSEEGDAHSAKLAVFCRQIQGHVSKAILMDSSELRNRFPVD